MMTEMTEPFWCYLNPTKAADEIVRLKDEIENIRLDRDFAWYQLEQQRGVLRLMLVDPPSTLDEPDTDAEVLVKLRRIVREYFAENTTKGKP